MSVTLVERVQRREHLWSSFLTTLTDEEKVRLFVGETELMMHDAYVQGEMSLVDIRLVLAIEPEFPEVPSWPWS